MGEARLPRMGDAPGPALTFLRSANSLDTLKSLFTIGVEHLSWIKGV